MGNTRGGGGEQPQQQPLVWHHCHDNDYDCDDDVEQPQQQYLSWHHYQDYEDDDKLRITQEW